VTPRPVPRVLRLAVTGASIGGALLFAWSLRTAGLQDVIDDVRRLGIGFVLVFLLAGVRHLARTAAWTFCVEPPDHLPLGRAFAAYLAGDSLGNVTPFGFLISEPSKIVLVRPRVAPKASISSLTVETLFYSGVVAVMLVAGSAALWLSFSVPRPVHLASLAIFITAVACSVAAAWIVMTRRRLVSLGFARMIRYNIAREYFEARLPHVREIEDRIFGFVGRRPERVLPILTLEVIFHAVAVLEIWMVLFFISGSSATRPSLLTAFVLEYTNRTITTVFQFVPMWIGVDEAGTSVMTTALHLGPAAGVSLALIRKARLLAWTSIGIGLLLQQGLSVRNTLREAEQLQS
jgi:uncharacterized membrane protein YbhN (UPF0104 family)